MKNFLKSSAKILYNYVMVLIVFAIFIYPFMSITQDNFDKWLPLYSLIMFLFAFMIIYSDMKSLGAKERKPQYELNPYPMKGLVYGLTGTLPIALTVAVAALINLGNDIAERIKHVAINAFLGPLYFLVRWLNEATIGYIAAILLLPLIAMLGYLAGFYGVNIMEKIGLKKKAIPEKRFTKSPWNPTNVADNAGKKKKKAKKTTGGQ